SPCRGGTRDQDVGEVVRLSDRRADFLHQITPDLSANARRHLEKTNRFCGLGIEASVLAYALERPFAEKDPSVGYAVGFIEGGINLIHQLFLCVDANSMRYIDV